MKITPKNSIKLECRYCKQSKHYNNCDNKICSLNNKSSSTLKRMKRHCIDCIGSVVAVKNCSGIVLNNKDKKCYLWNYRLSKNPKLKNKNLEHLKKFYFQNKIAKKLKRNCLP